MSASHQDFNNNIMQVKVPLPFPLRWVNSYLIRGSNGITLIDPGLHTPEAEQVWHSTLAAQGIVFSDIEQIVLTHHHPDHYGLAGWFQEHTGGAPVFLSQSGLTQAQRFWGDGQPLSVKIYSLFLQHGMEQAAADKLLPHMNSFVEWVSPQPEVTILAPSSLIWLGDREYATIETPGHAAGHLCFYDPIDLIMFCGDHVIPQISPNVSYIPGMDPNPLYSFLTSLESIGKYDVRMAYPGHREPFATFTSRTKELILHHQERLEQMRLLLQMPTTAYQLCLSVFGDHLPIHQLRFAMSETLAHLIYLREAGEVREVCHNEIIYYEAVK